MNTDTIPAVCELCRHVGTDDDPVLPREHDHRLGWLRAQCESWRRCEARERLARLVEPAPATESDGPNWCKVLTAVAGLLLWVFGLSWFVFVLSAGLGGWR